MKKPRPVKHAHRKAIIAQRKAKGKYSRRDLPKPETCRNMTCYHIGDCWAQSRKDCLKPWCNTKYYKKKYGT